MFDFKLPFRANSLTENEVSVTTRRRQLFHSYSISEDPDAEKEVFEANRKLCRAQSTVDPPSHDPHSFRERLCKSYQRSVDGIQ